MPTASRRSWGLLQRHLSGAPSSQVRAPKPCRAAEHVNRLARLEPPAGHVCTSTFGSSQSPCQAAALTLRGPGE